MAKVTLKTKETAKVQTKDNEKSEKIALIDSLHTKATPIVKDWQTADKSAKNKLFSIIKWFREQVIKHNLSKADTWDLLKLSFAEAGGYNVNQLSGKDAQILHGTDYNAMSKVIGTVIPKKAEYAKELDKAIADKANGKKAYSNEAIKLVAQTGTKPVEKPAGRKPGSTTSKSESKKTKDTYDTLEEVQLALAGILQICEKSEFDDDEVEEALVEQLAKWKEREKEDSDSDDDNDE